MATPIRSLAQDVDDKCIQKLFGFFDVSLEIFGEPEVIGCFEMQYSDSVIDLFFFVFLIYLQNNILAYTCAYYARFMSYFVYLYSIFIP